MEEGGLYGERVVEDTSASEHSDELEADRIMEEWREQQDQVGRLEMFPLRMVLSPLSSLIGPDPSRLCSDWLKT